MGQRHGAGRGDVDERRVVRIGVFINTGEVRGAGVDGVRPDGAAGFARISLGEHIELVAQDNPVAALEDSSARNLSRSCAAACNRVSSDALMRSSESAATC